MTAGVDAPSFVLDEGVPNAVGRVLAQAGYHVDYVNEPERGMSDAAVAMVAVINGAVLVAIDSDMKRIAKAAGLPGSRYAALSLIKLSCQETHSAPRMRDALTLVLHEWNHSRGAAGRRIFMEIGRQFIRTNR